MGAPRVFITRNLPGGAFGLLKERCRVVNIPGDGTLKREELLRSLQEVEGIVSTLADLIDGEVMERAGDSLRVISNYAVGYNNIDVDEATRRGVVVCNTPDVLTDATADMAFAMLLAIARMIHRAHDFTVKNNFVGWDPHLFLGLPVWGRTLGIVGMGKIGTAIGQRAAGFRMRILYHNRNRVPEEVENGLGAEYRDLQELLRASDYVVVSASLNEGTRGMIGNREISLMKRSACLVNISRGEVIRESELAEALKAGVIRGAALDVYEREPEIHPSLMKLDNVLLLPHLGSATREARDMMASLCVENLLACLRGEEPPAAVNYHLLP